MSGNDPNFTVRLAETDGDHRAIQRLRYAVFIEELGGDGVMVDHENRLERDRFDQHCDHLMIIDAGAGGAGRVVGAYRLMTSAMAAQAGAFYSAGEYDLTALTASGRNILELGRSCLDAGYRGGMAMMHLWAGLVDYCSKHRIELLFGVASFHGTNVEKLKQPLANLHHHHLAPEPIRVRAIDTHFQRMDLVTVDQVDRVSAMRATPALIKAYLRMGGTVGEGAFVDHAFNTTDICLIMDTANISQKHLNLYARGAAG